MYHKLTVFAIENCHRKSRITDWRDVNEEGASIPGSSWHHPEGISLILSTASDTPVCSKLLQMNAAYCAAGLKLAVVSNFDTRLRPLLDALELSPLFDTIVVSAEVGAEKPNPLLFETACSQLGIDPEEALHVGDDRRCMLILKTCCLLHQ